MDNSNPQTSSSSNSVTSTPSLDELKLLTDQLKNARSETEEVIFVELLKRGIESVLTSATTTQVALAIASDERAALKCEIAILRDELIVMRGENL